MINALVTCCNKRSTILRRKKDGDWYIYPWFLGHENLNNVHKNVQKSYKIFKPSMHNILSTRTNIVKIWLSLSLGYVRFARYCGKMYSRHFFFLRWIETIIEGIHETIKTPNTKPMVLIALRFCIASTKRKFALTGELFF